MPDNTLAYTTIFPSWSYADVRCRHNSAGHKYVLAYPWGAPRLRAAALSSLPACAPSPLPARNLHPLCSPTAARSRTNAVTLGPLCAAGDFRRFPSGRVAAGRTHPRFSLRRAPSLSSPAGFVLPAVALAPPRFQPSRAVRLISDGRTSRVVALKARAEPCGTLAE